MHFATALVALVGAAAAFPSIPLELNNNNQKRSGGTCSTSAACENPYTVDDSTIGYKAGSPTPAQQASAARQNCGNLVPCGTFDAQEQFVSTTGQHAYASPAAGDIRGPCPGLNAAANHGYLPRDGVASLTETVEGLGALYGMSVDLSGFLAAYAIAFDGDLINLAWSIGGPQQQLTSAIPGLGAAQGISWSHNKYEGDSSIGRCDAFINNGDAHSLSVQKFKDVYETAENDRYTLDTMSRAFTKNTYRSIAQNEKYFAPLFSTTLVSPAAYNFVVAMMSNHTSDEVGGYLDGEIFKTFFGITGQYPDFTWIPGQERVPDNWYRRPSATPYTAHTGVFGDLLSEFAAYDGAFRFGGNTNGVNTYNAIDMGNFTNGAYTMDNIMDGDNFACLIYQTIQQGLPDALTASGGLGSATGLLSQYLGPVFGALSCPEVSQFNDNNLPGQYPGHSYSPSGPATNC